MTVCARSSDANPSTALLVLYVLSSGSSCCRSAVKYWFPASRPLLRPALILTSAQLCIPNTTLPPAVSPSDACASPPSLSAARLYNSTHCRLHVDPASHHSPSLCIFASHPRRSCSPHPTPLCLPHACTTCSNGRTTPVGPVPVPLCHQKTHRHSWPPRPALLQPPFVLPISSLISQFARHCP